MLFFYLLLGYLLGSIPGIAFFSGNLDNYNKKTMIIPKKGITVSYYPAFAWQWIFLIIELLKLLLFYYLLKNNSIIWILGFSLGHIYPIWKPNLHKSIFSLLSVFIFQTNIFLFSVFLLIEPTVILFNKNLKDIPLVIVSFILSIYFWVSGADIFYVLASLVFFLFSSLRFLTVNKKTYLYGNKL